MVEVDDGEKTHDTDEAAVVEGDAAHGEGVGGGERRLAGAAGTELRQLRCLDEGGQVLHKGEKLRSQKFKDSPTLK